MTRTTTLALAGALAVGAALIGIGPAQAQSTGYVTGFNYPDPAADDEFGWGPAYRPETSFSQPGTPPTPGDYARRGARTYIQGPGVTGSIDPGFEAAPRRAYRQQRAVRAPVYEQRRMRANGETGRRTANRERSRSQ